MDRLSAFLAIAVLVIGLPSIASADEERRSHPGSLVMISAVVIHGTGATPRPDVTIVFAAGQIAEICLVRGFAACGAKNPGRISEGRSA
jgi:hypothetical protein